MKGMKKLLSILMVLTLVLSLGASAFAATVTIEQKDDSLPNTHSYDAYQVFTGEMADPTDDKSEMGNIKWGNGVDKEAFVTALMADETIGSDFAFILSKDGKSAPADGEALAKDDDQVARNIAEVLSGYTSDAKIKAFGKVVLDHKGTQKYPLVNGTTDVPVGYYVIEDVTTDLAEGEVKNDIVVEVVGDLVITPKNVGPSSKKKVKDVNDSDADQEDNGDWQDSADHDIGDHIEYRLEATIPATALKAYDTYKLTFEDILCKDLKLDEGSIQIEVGGTGEKGTGKVVTSSFSGLNATTIADPTAYGVPADDYTGGTHLEWVCEDIKQLDGVDEATVTIYIYYTAELLETARTGVPGNPNTFRIKYSRTPKEYEEGTTEWDTVIVFTYKGDVEKVDQDLKPLDGATFQLEKWDDTAEAWKPVGPAVTPTKDAEGNYVGEFKKGLDDGKYRIVETVTPPGYNTIDPIEFEIKATHEYVEGAHDSLTDLDVYDSEGNKLNSSKEEGKTATFEVDMTEGKTSTTVVNDHGVKLPETGGIGTTIFYIAGAILVAGAVILLVTKKRVSGMEK